MKGFVIAAPMTGSGKTTVTLGLLAALNSRGLRAQSFKVGPDFIDPGLHQLSTGVPAHNLDTWMLSAETNKDLFASATQDCDVAIVEGMMGLYDGFDGRSDLGSTAEIARLLDLPVVLVVDASPLARSAAALVEGYRAFDPSLKWAGVIFNRVAGQGHFRIFENAVKSMPILGWLPSDSAIQIRERHLGLLTGQEPEARHRIERIGGFVESHLHIDGILDRVPAVAIAPARPARTRTPKLKLAVAQDPAFSFYYHANLMALRDAGAEIVPFSAMRDPQVPDADMLYLGGGYPEIYRRELEANVSMRRSIRRFVESGKRIYAECGGLMYLARAIEDSQMVGSVPTNIRMTDRLVDFGYSEVRTTMPSILGPAGTVARGHQFHYSTCDPPSSEGVYSVTQGQRRYPEGFRLANGIASYVHLHFLSNPSLAANMVESSV